jgi:hypothetical protein
MNSEFRTVSKYINFGTIRPIWEQIFPIENEYFFDQILSILIRIRIVSNRTTSISVELYEYRRYLLKAALKRPSGLIKIEGKCKRF